MNKKTIFLMITLCVAMAFTPSIADTYTDSHGQTWTYTVSGRAATLTAVADKTMEYPAEDIPWTFTNNGTNYTVTAIGADLCSNWSNLKGKLTIPASVKSMGSQAFISCSGLTGLVIEEGLRTLPYQRTFYSCGNLSGSLITPHSLFYIGKQTFLWIGEKLTSVWFKGPETATSGEQQYLTLNDYAGNIMYPHNKLGLKVALFGQYTKPDGQETSNNVLHELNGCIIYLPDNGNWTKERLDIYFDGTKTVLYYGEGKELDISIDEMRNVLTATPTTEHALTNVLASAAIFKSDFGLDTHISITNAFAFSSAVFAGTAAQGVTFDRVFFAAKNQTELSAILAAIPETVPIAIDPADLKETLTIPGNREVDVKTGKGYKIKKLQNGFAVISD